VSLTSSGPFTVTQDGAVVDALDVNGTITVAADNVTIKRTRITAGQFYGILTTNGARNLSIQDVDILGQSGCEAGIAGDNYSAVRIDVSGCIDGMKVGDNTTILDSYIHNLRVGGGSHNDGIQGTGGRGYLIKGNYIPQTPGENSAIILGEEFGPMDNAVIDGNWLDGGNFTLYIGYGTTNPNATIINNRFGRSYQYGLLSANPKAGVVWSGNVWDDTGLVTPPF